jgi:hypothetical protein
MKLRRNFLFNDIPLDLLILKKIIAESLFFYDI